MKYLKLVKGFISSLNAYGLPVPLIRDPKTGRGDIALTLVFLSSIWVQIGLIGKYSKFFDSIDISSAINWFGICAGLYWARKVGSDKTSTPETTLLSQSKSQSSPDSHLSRSTPDSPE